MTKLVALKASPAPDEAVVKMAEVLLEDARSGKLRAFICAAAYDEPAEPGCTATLRAGVADVATLVCALERAKLRLLSEE